MSDNEKTPLFIVTFYHMGNPNRNKSYLITGIANHLAAISYAISNKGNLIDMKDYHNYNRVESRILNSLERLDPNNNPFRLYRL